MKTMRRSIGITLAAAAIWGGCQAGQVPLSSKAGDGAPSGWTSHQDPAGFSISLPPGWRARADGPSGRAFASGPEGGEVVIWPVFIPRGFGNSAAGVSATVEQLARRVYPKASWQPAQAAGPGTARLAGTDGARRIAASFAWVETPKGVSGTFYCVNPGPDFDAEKQRMYASILESFAAVGPEQAAAPPVRYERWSDPNENAFSLEAPAGWQVGGGLFRFASVDTRTEIVATSPDGAVRVAGGDRRIPTFAVPNPTLSFAGFTEGRWYSPGYGVQMMVRRFVPGADFAAEYAQTQVGEICPSLAIERRRDRPDAVEAINRVNAQYGQAGMAIQSTAGEVAFGCSMNGRPMRGYYYSTAQLVQAYGMGLWSVPYLYGYLAPAEREAEAQQVLAHMVQTLQINPQWEAMQQGITANTSAIVAGANAAITQMINRSFEQNQAAMDEISRRRSNANRGVVDVVDPVSGQDFQVESGSNYYWIDQRGSIVGTDIYNRPTIDFREMVQLP